MKEKTLLIGGHSGIGQAFAYYWEERTDVWGLMEEQLLRPTQQDLDITDEFEVAQFLYQHGPFNRIVYSAGLDRLDWLGQTSMVDVRDVFAVNVFGVISLVDTHLRLFPEATADVVVVGSDAAERPLRTSTAYCSSKAAVHMAVRTMARELGPKGWRLNVVAPGMTDNTGMQEYVDARVPEIRGWTPEEALAYERSQEVVPGRIDKKEVAQVIWNTLNGPRHLNGSIIVLNGGR